MEKEKLTKAEMVDNIHTENPNLAKGDIQQSVDGFIEEINRGLEDGKTIELRGLGTFELRTVKGRPTARNPRTGEYFTSEDHLVASFRPGKVLQRRINNRTYKDE